MEAHELQSVQDTLALLLAAALDANELTNSRLDALAKVLSLLDIVRRLFAHSPGVFESVCLADPVLKSLRLCLGDSSSKDIRIYGYRIFRSLVSAASIRILFKHHLDVFILRTLIRDARYDSEREHALRFIRSCLDEPEGPFVIPTSIVRMLVAISEQLDDKFRNVCIETICEIAIRNPEAACYAGGTKAMFLALLEGPPELIDPITDTFLYLLDSAASRPYVRPHVELEMVIAQFTDAYTSKVGYNIEKLQWAAAIICKVLSTWTGLVYFSVGGLRSIRSVIAALGLANDDTRKVLLDMIYDLFNIPRGKAIEKPATAAASYAAKGSTASMAHASNGSLARPSTRPVNLVVQYKAMLLMVFINAGLIDTLIQVMQDKNRDISASAMTLVAAILELSSRQLPASFSAKVQSLPSLFSIASNFHDEASRHIATSKLSHILSFPLTVRAEAASVRLVHESAKGSDIHERLGSIKSRISHLIDDMQIKALLNDSEVLGVKDYSKWNWEVIGEIVSGPLLNPKRFDELVRSTKFSTRLIAFFRPSSRQYSDLSRDPLSAKMTHAAVDLLHNLSATFDGARYLAETRLLLEIVDHLSQLIQPGSAALTPDDTFSKEHMQQTVSGEYFAFIRAVATQKEGARVIEQCGVYNLFYQLVDVRLRDDITLAMLTTMDYSDDGHPRIILSKILTGASKTMRLAATQYLEHVAAAYSSTFHEWGVALLLTQIYDPAPEVAKAAVDILQQLCQDPAILAVLVQMQPEIEHLSQVGNMLLIQMLGIPSGFKYLAEPGYLEAELDYWFEHGIYQYVTHVELSVSEGMAKTARLLSIDCLDKDLTVNLHGTVPPHLYGELAKTVDGVSYLERIGHVTCFVDTLRSYKDVLSTPAGVVQIKAALWALGSIGGSSFGLSLLTDAKALDLVLEMLREAAVLSVRGTCFYILGLMGQSARGMELMQDIGWCSEGVCVPHEPESILNLAEWDFSGSWPARQALTYKPIHYRIDPIEDEVLKCIGNLSNHILATAASKRLAAIRQQHPHYFVKPELCVQAWRVCTCYHYRVATRRFIQELFERLLLDAHALRVVDDMDGLRLSYPVNDAESAKLNENAFKSSLSLLPRDAERPESRKGSTVSNAGNRINLAPKRVVRGF